MKKYYKFLILVVIVIIGCASKKSIAGYYTNTPKPHSGIDELVLFQNGTYTYTFNGHMTGYKSSGRWIVDSLQNVYLTSKKQPSKSPQVVESRIYNDTIITIKVFLRETGDILPYANIILYSKNKMVHGVVTNLEGIAELDNLNTIDSIRVSYVGFHDVVYKIKNRESNNFKIELDKAISDYLYLKDEKLIIKNKKLLWTNSSGSYRVLKKR